MGLVRYVQRRIEARLKAAVARARGDAALTAAIGRILSRPELVERAYGEGETFLVKAALRRPRSLGAGEAARRVAR